jgi:hypothetical protein
VADQNDDSDLGAPVTELQDLSLAVNDRFGRKVRGRIERRALTGEFLGLAWTAPAMTLLELLRVPFELFRGKHK